MKNKILALTLGTILTLSSTTAFAADVNTIKFDNLNDLYNLLNTCNLNYTVPETTYNAPVVTQATELKQETQKVQPTVNNAQPQENKAATTAIESAPAPSSVSYEERVAQLVNIERQKNGLQPLTFDKSISNVARLKSKDMADNNYFAHQSPRYGSAGDMLRNNGINWSAWGENIASGQRTPEAVVSAWMNSPGHRANILSTNFGKIGIGYVTNANGTPYWTQMFTN